LTDQDLLQGPQEEAQKAGKHMSKIRIAIASVLAIASLAGGVATHTYTAPRPAHHLADEGCCDDQGATSF
jgi:hypothetical protein